jgi:hypothetical protein
LSCSRITSSWDSPDFGNVAGSAGSSPQEGYIMGIIGSRTVFSVVVKEVYQPIIPIT